MKGKSLLATINGLSKFNQESLLNSAAAAKLFNQSKQQQGQASELNRPVSPYSSYMNTINTVSNTQLSPTHSIKTENQAAIDNQQGKMQQNLFHVNSANNVQNILSQQQKQQQQGQFQQMMSPNSALNISISNSFLLFETKIHFDQNNSQISFFYYHNKKI